MENFSSFPPEEEREFVVYEERLHAAKRSATLIGIGTAAAFGVVFLAIVIGFWSELKPIIPPDDTARRPAPAATTTAPAPTAPAPTAPAPAEAAPATAPAPAAETPATR